MLVLCWLGPVMADPALQAGRDSKHAPLLMEQSLSLCLTGRLHDMGEVGGAPEPSAPCKAVQAFAEKVNEWLEAPPSDDTATPRVLPVESAVPILRRFFRRHSSALMADLCAPTTVDVEYEWGDLPLLASTSALL
mmetsp:Transcript_37218/g.93418  ORF Transcript_37218/g.93418 Transcript_37218/m.93418 type:complete len:135 (+) Transcript_37218:301-705(+)